MLRLVAVLAFSGMIIATRKLSCSGRYCAGPIPSSAVRTALLWCKCRDGRDKPWPRYFGCLVVEELTDGSFSDCVRFRRRRVPDSCLKTRNQLVDYAIENDLAYDMQLVHIPGSNNFLRLEHRCHLHCHAWRR
jgi:hypothetical protein